MSRNIQKLGFFVNIVKQYSKKVGGFYEKNLVDFQI